ncbi:MAG TPA: HNH endonuclease signature motif containing protein [Bacteroidia bacterium]|jgi:5-methylcytosine-specific restriction endonuclease McrA|nr:HNH endonuclease signature motif containing protein [Bacteroidia bacterium]
MDKDLRLNKIYDKTDGHCHICHKKLSFSKYGATGGWEIEHSVARANGGTDHLNNLFAAHISCNREKGTYHTRTARGWNGNTRAPYSKAKKQKIKNSNTATGAVVGGLVGLLLGPVGAAVGAAIGGAIGSNNSPKR